MMTKKYIDADMLLKWAKEFYPIDTHFQCAIINAPSVDVEPVKHGKWIGDIYPCCSVCGETSDYYCDGTHKRSKRCPNCGAKMDIE